MDQERSVHLQCNYIIIITFSPQSTLLQCLLGELEAHDGHVVITGRVSYASQEPWMFSASMRENILFGLPYRRDWYKSVIEACALDKVVSNFTSLIYLPTYELNILGY